MSKISRLGEKENEFCNYFLTFKSKLIKQTMRADIRTTAGLGFPPIGYNQNPNESINAVILRKIKSKNIYGKCSMSQFIDILEEIIIEQNDKIRQCMLGIGDFKIKDDFTNAFTKPINFSKLNNKQKYNEFRRLDTLYPNEYKNSLKSTNNFVIPGIIKNNIKIIFYKIILSSLIK
jgi:hypothetical protein